MTTLYNLIAVALLLASPASFAGADYAREQRWADEFLPAVLVGDAITLKQANRHEFVGLLAEADKARMALVVVHGMGIHPDWGMVSNLRQGLYEAGYTTLSIQMPVLAADASYAEYPAVFPEAAERLQLAVSYLKQKGYQRIAIVSHSNGSRMSRVYMANNPKDVVAWAALSLTQGDTFTGVKVPILDLYAGNDLPHVLDSVAQRKASLTNKASRQVVIGDTDHFFANHETDMVNAVKDFLDTLKTQHVVQLGNLSGKDPVSYCPSWE